MRLKIIRYHLLSIKLVMVFKTRIPNAGESVVKQVLSNTAEKCRIVTIFLDSALATCIESLKNVHTL